MSFSVFFTQHKIMWFCLCAERPLPSPPSFTSEADKSCGIQIFKCFEPTHLQDCKLFNKCIHFLTPWLLWCKSRAWEDQQFPQQEHSASAPHCRPVQAKTDRLRGKRLQCVGWVRIVNNGIYCSLSRHCLLQMNSRKWSQSCQPSTGAWGKSRDSWRFSWAATIHKRVAPTGTAEELM